MIASPIHSSEDSYSGNDVDMLKATVSNLKSDLCRRQASYVRRAEAFTSRIKELEEELRRLKDEKLGGGRRKERMQEIKHLHNRVLDNVKCVQTNTALMLREQESDLLKTYTAHLFNTKTAEPLKKSRSEDLYVQSKASQIEELKWATKTMEKLDKENQNLSKKLLDSKRLAKSYDGDRNILLKQVVALKNENDHLRENMAELEMQMSNYQSFINQVPNGMPQTRPKTSLQYKCLTTKSVPLLRPSTAAPQRINYTLSSRKQSALREGQKHRCTQFKF